MRGKLPRPKTSHHWTEVAVLDDAGPRSHQEPDVEGVLLRVESLLDEFKTAIAAMDERLIKTELSVRAIEDRDIWNKAVEHERRQLPQTFEVIAAGINQRIDDFKTDVNARLDAQDGELREIRVQTTATNGNVIRHGERLGALERDRDENEDDEDRDETHKHNRNHALIGACAAIVAALVGANFSAISHFLLSI